MSTDGKLWKPSKTEPRKLVPFLQLSGASPLYRMFKCCHGSSSAVVLAVAEAAQEDGHHRLIRVGPVSFFTDQVEKSSDAQACPVCKDYRVQHWETGSEVEDSDCDGDSDSS